MKIKSTLLGSVQDVRGTSVSVMIGDDANTGLSYINGEGYRIGQIGSFIKIPIGYNSLFGIVSQVGASAVPESRSNSLVSSNRWLTIQLVGEGSNSGRFERGISQYPTVGDEVHVVSDYDLEKIYGDHGKPYFFRVGHIAGAESIPALIDINKLVTRHSAVLGTTGSGKSTTVATILSALSNPFLYPSSRILVFDLHGEYGNALQDRANILKITSDTHTTLTTSSLHIPYWALSFDEFIQMAFGDCDEKDKSVIGELVFKLKYQSATAKVFDGVDLQKISVDTPIPFSINVLWLQLCRYLHSTHSVANTGQKFCDIAAPFDHNSCTEAFLENADGTFVQLGDAESLTPPKYQTQAAQKIFLSGINLNIRRQFESFTSRLKDTRYSFLFQPGDWTPDLLGLTKSDLGDFFEKWIGTNRPITILDLSGVPQTILTSLIGALLRILYEGLFWSRNLSQGGRNRPLLIVMEEAHNYLNDSLSGSCTGIVQRVAKEGRKYGIGIMVVSQRPSEISQTILSQCGTFFSLRLSNSVDRGHVTSAVSDNLEGLTNMLPLLKTGEAIILGEAVKLPMRAIIDVPVKERRPDSQDPIIYDENELGEELSPGGWGIQMEKKPNFDEFAETIRSQNPLIKRVIK